eukprot:jgi/Orpsp1_1/1175661/evm.model.c7180000054749.1
MNEIKNFKKMMEIVTRLSLQSYGVDYDEYKESQHIFKEDPNDYGDTLKPILKSTEVAYVLSNEYYDAKNIRNKYKYDNDNNKNKKVLNVNKLKYEYNPNRRDSYFLNTVIEMIFNNMDKDRGFAYYPFSFEKLINFFEEMNIEVNLYLVKTKYHYWDDINGQEIYDDYEKEFNKKDDDRYLSYYYYEHKPRPIVEITPIRYLDSKISLPLCPSPGISPETCHVYFIAIKAKNGLTCLSKLFSLLYMPEFEKKKYEEMFTVVSYRRRNNEKEEDNNYDNDDSDENDSKDENIDKENSTETINSSNSEMNKNNHKNNKKNIRKKNKKNNRKKNKNKNRKK